ncbi:efflux RND transporter periplasmic adaptor subunit [Fictibacillus barbaricus]|uniref:Efflux RND transporter periplasmic adaptor subunit n=1 Tax=Fictibacillus barbaricus TaxID=182136 RepID=A0ABS2ZCJ3_9BACL|nr:efflux RND transporter periplasmic adaptor subunit [Fictibacillus barbaricus]MBN3545412.1 efflux RND transporter periplasmic adaptor subunit [Fictibacillus barbaricus]GGB59236.1 ABC transporter substrate-binding protein [Fictibacillus barbaricus]
MNRLKWIAAALMVVLLIVMNVMIFDKKESAAIEAPRMETGVSTQKDFVKKHEVTGVAQSKNTFNIYQNHSLGHIKEIIVAKGETVTSGQTLITYENKEIEKEIRELKRDQEAADVRADHFSSQVTKWQSEISSFDDEKDSADAKVLIQEQLAEAELQSDLAENESSVLNEEIAELEKQLEALSIKSPADGIVSEVNGIGSEDPLLTIVGQGNFELVSEIEQNIASMVRTGDSVVIMSSDTKKVNGTVQTVLPNEESKKFKMTVLVEGEAAWTEGQTGKIFVTEKLAENAVSVPQQAILKDDGSTYVLTIVKNKIYKMKVSTGIQQKEDVQIKKGLKKGQAIVLNPSPVFVSGQPVLKK